MTCYCKTCNVKDELTIADEIILRGHNIVMPTDLLEQAVNLAHAGHQGIVKTKALIQEKIWFPGIDAMVEHKVKECLSCQAATSNAEKIEPLNMTPMPEAPWTEVAMDFKGPLPNGDYLLLVYDMYISGILNYFFQSAKRIVEHLEVPNKV